MRVATFNILNGRSPADGTVDLGRLRDAVADLDADVLALQEVDRDQPRSQGADLTAVAAAAMGASEHRFVAALSGTPGAAWVAATDDEEPSGASYGIALLSRYPVVSWEVIRLPSLPVRMPMWSRGHVVPTLVRDEPRVAVAAVVDAPTGRLTVASTHLSFVPWWNGRQLLALVSSLAALPRPLVLMGDLNMRPARASALAGLTPLVRARTFPAHRPVKQIDHVLADGVLAVAGRARQLPLSDHRALVVDLT